MSGPVERHYEEFRNPNNPETGGLLFLSGAFLDGHREEIFNLIEREGRMAEERNPDHKISKIDKTDGKVVVETTDQNLAMKIGKALNHAYKGNHEYKFTKGEKSVEVRWHRD